MAIMQLVQLSIKKHIELVNKSYGEHCQACHGMCQWFCLYEFLIMLVEFTNPLITANRKIYLIFQHQEFLGTIFIDITFLKANKENCQLLNVMF